MIFCLVVLDAVEFNENQCIARHWFDVGLMYFYWNGKYEHRFFLAARAKEEMQVIC